MWKDERVLAQLAADFSVAPEALALGETLFVPRALRPGRRVYESDACALRVLSFGNTAVFACRDEALLSALRERFAELDAAWLSEPPALRALDALLLGFGHRVADAHHYYVPCARAMRAAPPVPAGVTLQILERDALARFEGDDRFCEALAFSPEHPDMLAVTATADGTLAGMAGASADGLALWQIGVNVEPEWRGRGMAVCLVETLKNAVVERGRLPFYGTVESHIVSQRVAVAAGFAPAWWELYTESVE